MTKNGAIYRIRRAGSSDIDAILEFRCRMFQSLGFAAANEMRLS